jgi:2'-5' RNA ligase
VQDHHITLVFLGADVDDETFDRACAAVKDAAAVTPALSGTAGGPVRTFPEGEDGIPAWLEPQVPGMSGLQAKVAHLSASEHPWRPHVTLGYLQPGEPVPDDRSLAAVRFGSVAVHRGSSAVSYPLSG